jgi:hypothetical protein
MDGRGTPNIAFSVETSEYSFGLAKAKQIGFLVRKVQRRLTG